MTEAVQVQVVIVFGTIITGIVGTGGVIIVAMLNRTRQHAKAAQEQVQNSHEINLRDDLDEKFEGLADLVKSVVLDVGGMRSDIRGIRREALVDRQAAATDREHIRHLEDTLTPAQLERVRSEHKEKP